MRRFSGHSLSKTGAFQLRRLLARLASRGSLVLHPNDTGADGKWLLPESFKSAAHM